MQCVTQRIDDQVVLTVTGVADLSSAPELHTALRKVVDDHVGERVLIDLDGVSSLDDAALGFLLATATHARDRGGVVELVCSDERLRRRLAATRLDEIVNIRGAIGGDPDSGYTAVIFTNQRAVDDGEEYAAEAGRMERLASEQPGYLGLESVRGDDGVGITVSYWATTADATAWKRHSDHLLVQRAGRERWYEWYRVRVATVGRQYFYDHADAPPHDDTAAS